MKIFQSSVAMLTTAIFAYALGSPAPAASENGAVMAVFNKAIDAFNRGDMKGWIATCSPGAAIIDEIPPHSWQGASACADWWRSFQSFAKANRITEASVSIRAPSHLEVTARTAYMVVPATYSYHENGKLQREAGIFTVAFKKPLNGWMMSGWAWTLQ